MDAGCARAKSVSFHLFVYLFFTPAMYKNVGMYTVVIKKLLILSSNSSLAQESQRFYRNVRKATDRGLPWVA